VATELTATSGDCDDNNIAVNPAATEVCNGIDDDCDLSTDEGVLLAFYQDADNDTYGNPGMEQMACTAPMGYVANNTDCDDTDALEFPGQTWFKDADGDDYSDGTSLVQCTRPANYFVATELTATSGDCDDNNIAVNPAATEVCNGIDDDCDLSTDEGVLLAFYQDADNDTYGNPAMEQMACTAPMGYVANNTDCDDNNIAVNPGATEVCNGIDDDCDLSTDEGVLLAFYQDADNDTYGNPAIEQMACTAPMGYVADNTDCDDTDALEFPGQTWFLDGDGDGYSNGTTLVQCLRPANYFTANELTGGPSGDCNDGNAAVNPEATEICNGIDDDCSGSAEAATNTWNGNGNNSTWDDAANWSDEIVPLECQNVVIPTGFNVNVPTGFTGKGLTLDVATGALLTVPVSALLDIQP
jgi:hypothetical protein